MNLLRSFVLMILGNFNASLRVAHQKGRQILLRTGLFVGDVRVAWLYIFKTRSSMRMLPGCVCSISGTTTGEDEQAWTRRTNVRFFMLLWMSRCCLAAFGVLSSIIDLAWLLFLAGFRFYSRHLCNTADWASLRASAGKFMFMRNLHARACVCKCFKCARLMKRLIRLS